MTHSGIMRPMIAFVLAVIAVFLALPEGRAQTQEPILPRLSVPTLQYFKNNPAAWSEFVSHLPRRPAGPPQPTQNRALPPSGGTWTAVTTAALPASVQLCNPLLLTDGTVIAFNCVTTDWYKLTPDNTGSYVNGIWSQIASLPSGYGPEWFSSAVLPDGRVIIEGGEYNISCSTGPTWTSLGAIYDPVADTWTAVSPPSGSGWINTEPCSGGENGGIGDAPSIVLPNGTFLLAGCCASPAVDALFNALTLRWTSTGAPTILCASYCVGTNQGEQGYTLLPDGNVLTISVWRPPKAQQYTPGTGRWTDIAPTPVSLVDPIACGNYEIGPAVTRPDGTVVAFGANTGCTASPADPTAIYNSSNNSWVQGQDVPAVCGSGGTTSCTLSDAPATMLPNGNIFFAASVYNTAPTHFFEFSSANAISQVADPISAGSSSVAGYYNFLVLPSGHILVTDFSNAAEVYTPTGGPNSAWLPTISSVPNCVAPNGSYTVSGVQLNGLSQGAAYGDDVQGATNYPLVRIKNNSTGHVFYARTSNFSTMSIAPGQSGSANFKVASATETGASSLYVIANGIASAAASVTVSTLCPATHDFNGDGYSDIAWRDTAGDLAIWLMNGTQILSGPDLGNVPTNWTIVGQRQLNNSGYADLIWRDTAGDLAIWFMNGTQVVSAPVIGNIPTSWSIVGTSGYKASNGYAELFWRSNSGDVAIWQINGSHILAAPDVGNVPTSWTIAGTGDFAGTGATDILWRGPNGDVAIWFMNGTQIVSAPDFVNVPTSWTIVGTGDFNGDGKTDILWRSSTGDVGIWLMNGTQILSSADLGNVPTSWSIVETGDFNGDGYSDILWRGPSGDVAIWFMNGTQIVSSPDFGNVPTSWTIQGANAD